MKGQVWIRERREREGEIERNEPGGGEQKETGREVEREKGRTTRREKREGEREEKRGKGGKGRQREAHHRTLRRHANLRPTSFPGAEAHTNRSQSGRCIGFQGTNSISGLVVEYICLLNPSDAADDLTRANHCCLLSPHTKTQLPHTKPIQLP